MPQAEPAAPSRETLASVRLAVFDFDGVFLQAVGLPVVPADAWPEAREHVRWVLTRPGGEGCVREFCDAIWKAQA